MTKEVVGWGGWVGDKERDNLEGSEQRGEEVERVDMLLPRLRFLRIPPWAGRLRAWELYV